MALIKRYRTLDGEHDFKFRFLEKDDYIEIYCLEHPPLEHFDPSPTKTHLFSSGLICITAGREPHTQQRAEDLAKQWAEYFLDYTKTGNAQA